MSSGRSAAAGRRVLVWPSFFGLFHGLGFAGGLLSAMEGMTGLAIGRHYCFQSRRGNRSPGVVLPLFGVLRVLRGQGQATNRVADGLFRYGSTAIALAGVVYFVAALRIR